MLWKLSQELLLKIVELTLLELSLNLELNMPKMEVFFTESMEILEKSSILKILIFGNLLQLKSKFIKPLLKLVLCF